jgi:DNA-binding HxlR family transcriptional regulator
MRYAAGMTRTNKIVGYSPKSKYSVPTTATDCSPEAAAEAFELLEGRWKLVIIHNLFGREGATSPVMRFSELERAIPNVSQKMLIQQLRSLERDGIVLRTIHPQVPPKVEYQLTEVGEALRPTLRALLDWAAPEETPQSGLVLRNHDSCWRFQLRCGFAGINLRDSTAMWIRDVMALPITNVPPQKAEARKRAVRNAPGKPCFLCRDMGHQRMHDSRPLNGHRKEVHFGFRKHVMLRSADP